MQKQVILVAGMHRSGTSLLNRLLNLHGVHIPLEMEYKDEFNERGYWESFEVQALNDKILRLADSSWFDLRELSLIRQPTQRIEEIEREISEFANRLLAQDAHIFSIKDPRICRVLPLWRSAFESCGARVSAIIPYRHPFEVAASINKRDGFSRNYCLSLWLRNVLDAEFATRTLDRVFCSYQGMLTDWPSELSKIREKLQLSSLRPSSRIKKQVSDFISGALRHWSFSEADTENGVSWDEFTYKTYQLLGLCDREDNVNRDAQFDDIRIALDTLGAPILENYLISEKKSPGTELRYSKHRLQKANLQIQAIERQLASKRQAIQQLEARNIGLVNETQQLEAKNTELVKVTHQLETQNIELVKVMLQLEVQNIELVKVAQQLEDGNIELVKVTQQLEARNIGLVNETRQLEARNIGLVNETRQLEARNIGLVNETQQLEARNIELVNRVCNQTEQLDSLDLERRQQKQELADLESQVKSAQAIANSLSWRITRPLRAIYDHVSMAPRRFSKSFQLIKKLISGNQKLTEQLEIVKQEIASRHYVPITTESPPSNLPVQLIAFYLPQFHPIAENDAWWGKGFTEWVNVKPAKPRFSGHYQPRVPGELGYYDLRDLEVQKRQVELARLYGLGGFCFYFYWFNGTRLLEAPILQYRDNTDLVLPYCLCWANENWSRTWDGLENLVLIGQEHSEADDLAFIQYISEYFLDERYIRIDGKPLLLVYRPGLLPDARATVARWRKWCHQNGIGEIFLAYTQSFNIVDPAIYGFDAAIEFPPNLTGPDVVTDQMKTLDMGFSGFVYDWASITLRAREYQEPEYTLFRTVNPMWDNTARRKNKGAIFLGSTPKAYGEWLESAARDTVKRFTSPSARLVFVNAWNEWAEGAYLEPDQSYGYAYLQATRDALEKVSGGETDKRIVLVVHDALAHGAQYLTLYLAKTLTSAFGFKVDLVVLGGGLLLPEFERWASVHNLAGKDPDGPEAVRLAIELYANGSRAAIINTTVSGAYIESLAAAGFRCISLVHELSRIIDAYGLHQQAASIAEHAAAVVFATREVADSFLDFACIPEDKKIIRPQGLYKKNAYRNDNHRARSRLRTELSLDQEARVVLGVGYLDHRKGVDLFVDAALQVTASIPDVYFVWVGHWESSMKALIEAKLAATTSHDKVLFVGRKDDTDMYYAGADVFVLSSREDPFPSTAMESLEVGVPVVAFKDAGGIVSLLQKGCGIMVPFEDTLRLAEAIMELLKTPVLARKLGSTGASLIDQEFSFRHYVYDLLDLAGMSRRRVSVVVPNYNYARHLRQRLNSIFLQTYPIFELIVLDDASSDNSLEVIKSCLAETDIDYQLIINHKNSGSVFGQWRKAIELARGDFIWICEADDFAKPDFLEKCIEKFNDPEIVLSYSQSMQVDENDQALEDDYLDYTNDISETKWQQDYVCDGLEELSKSMAIKNTIPNVSAAVFPKTAIQASLKRCESQLKALKVAGDWLVYTDLLQHGRIAFTAESLNAHRRHQKSVTIDPSNNERHMAEIIFMQNRISQLVKLEQKTIDKAKDFEQHSYRYLGLAERNEGCQYPAKHPEVIKWLNRISSSS